MHSCIHVFAAEILILLLNVRSNFPIPCWISVFSLTHPMRRNPRVDNVITFPPTPASIPNTHLITAKSTAFLLVLDTRNNKVIFIHPIILTFLNLVPRFCLVHLWSVSCMSASFIILVIHWHSLILGFYFFLASLIAGFFHKFLALNERYCMIMEQYLLTLLKHIKSWS